MESKPQPGFESFDAVSRARASPIVSVSQAKDEDKLVMTIGIKLDAADRQGIARLSKGARAALLRDLAWMLHSRGFAYEMDQSDAAIRSVTFSSQIFEDGLTKDRLMTAMQTLLSQYALMMMRMAEAVGDVSRDADAEASTIPVAKKSPQPGAAACTRCGTPLRTGARFCGTCGTPVQA